jgi:hypothetical protein
MRAKRVMSANLTRTKTEGNRYRVDGFRPDLRSARAGAYFLSTKRQDQAAYYYPLQIKELR